MANKTKQIAIRVRPETRNALEAAAEKDMRTLSSLAEKILVDWLREHGHLPKPDDEATPLASKRRTKGDT